MAVGKCKVCKNIKITPDYAWCYYHGMEVKPDVTVDCYGFSEAKCYKVNSDIDSFKRLILP